MQVIDDDQIMLFDLSIDQIEKCFFDRRRFIERQLEEKFPHADFDAAKFLVDVVQHRGFAVASGILQNSAVSAFEAEQHTFCGSTLRRRKRDLRRYTVLRR